MKGRSVVVSGSQVLTFQVAASTQSFAIALSPAAFTRTSQMESVFEYYRFTRVTAELLPAWLNASVSLADVNTVSGTLGYLPEEQTSSGTSVTQATCSQCEPHISHTVGLNGSTGVLAGSTISRRMIVPRKRLLSTPVKMYVCAASTEDVFVQQGTFIYALDTANTANEALTVLVDFRYVCEFFVPTTSALTVFKPIKTSDEDSKEDSDQLVVVEARRPPLKPPAARRA